MKEYCIKKRLKWSECAARNACRENEYYEDLIRYLRKNLAVCKFYLYIKKRFEERLHAMMKSLTYFDQGNMEIGVCWFSMMDNIFAYTDGRL